MISLAFTEKISQFSLSVLTLLDDCSVRQVVWRLLCIEVYKMSETDVSELIHQMGLIKGLAHCPNNRCVMFQSTSVQDTDKRGIQFCANCRKRLVLDN